MKQCRSQLSSVVLLFWLCIVVAGDWFTGYKTGLFLTATLVSFAETICFDEKSGI